MVIKLSKDVEQACIDFADARLKGSSELYKRRGEARLEKIRQDIITGALAEFAVKECVQSDARYCSEPDLTIYEQANKSYAADLESENCQIHVKSQTKEASERWGLSWIFQKNDPLVRQPESTDIIALTQVDGLSVEVIGLVSARTLLRERLIAEPRNVKYARTKRAVYYDELLASKINLWEI